MSNAEYLSTDQNYEDEETIYWFDLDETRYGVCESAEAPAALLDAGGYILDLSFCENKEILGQLSVTDRMRSNY